MRKAIWRKDKILGYETGKESTNGIMTFKNCKFRNFDNQEQAEKYVKRYLKDYEFSIEK